MDSVRYNTSFGTVCDIFLPTAFHYITYGSKTMLYLPLTVTISICPNMILETLWNARKSLEVVINKPLHTCDIWLLGETRLDLSKVGI